MVDEAIALYRRNWRQFLVLTVLFVALEIIAGTRTSFRVWLKRW